MRWHKIDEYPNVGLMQGVNQILEIVWSPQAAVRRVKTRYLRKQPIYIKQQGIVVVRAAPMKRCRNNAQGLKAG